MFYPSITLPAVIPSGQSQSGNLQTGGLHLIELLMPAAWDAAALTFLGSLDGTNFFPLVNDAGTEASFTVTANRVVRFPSGFFGGVPFLRLRSGNLTTPVNQTAARTINVFARQAQ